MSAAFLPALCSVTFRALTPEAVIALARDAGLAGIEWGGDLHVPPGRLDEAQRIGELTRAAGLAAASYGSYVAPPTDGLAEFDAALATTLALGATNIRIWPGTRNRDSDTYAPHERGESVRLIQEMAGRAAAAGLTIGLEYHPGALTDTAASAARLMAEISRANVFLYWQPRPGQPVAARLEEIAAVGRCVSHVHVFAWDAERQRYPLASEISAWRSCLAALPQSPFAGVRYAMIEFVHGDESASFQADAQTLRAICGPPSG